MAGHSKWANIKHKKGREDAKRGKIFTKVGREIQVAAKLGGGDPDMNPRLRLALQAARAVNLPKDNIKRSIEKGVGGGAGEDFEEIRYEGYGPGGVAIIVDTLTDNRNRTVGEVRSAFTKHDGNLGESGAVAFMFDRKGEIVYPADKGSADEMFEAGVEAGAENVESDDEYHYFTTAPDDFAAVQKALEEKFEEAERAGLVWHANTPAETDEDKARTLMKLIDVLEDNDDVQSVTTNFEADDAMMEKILNT